MNTKTALIILVAAVAIIAVIAIVSPKKDKLNTESKIDPETGEVILGTGGPEDESTPKDLAIVTEVEKPVVVPVNPDFPKTGFKPAK